MNLAPNGKPSNLTPEQYRLVRTPAFKNWFGDWEEAITKDYEGVSKIIDENGEPSICYHVTSNEFYEFNENYIGSKTDKGYYGKGFYFTEGSPDSHYGEREIPCFLNIQNPFSYKSTSKQYELDTNEIKQKGYDGVLVFPKFVTYNKNKHENIDVENIDLTLGLGYYGNRIEEIVAYYPEQIKLADGTNTTFDSNNLDIRYKDGGDIPEGTKLLPLTMGKFAIVDAEDFDYLNQWKWRTGVDRSRDGKIVNYYGQRTIYLGGKTPNTKANTKQGSRYQQIITLGKQIMDIPEDRKLRVDYIDGNKLNNQKSNIRVATISQINYGATSAIDKKKITSKYIGVSHRIMPQKKVYDKRTDKYYNIKEKNYWRVKIQDSSMGRKYEKNFPYTDVGEIKAAKWYDSMAKLIHGEFAVLNFPEDKFNQDNPNTFSGKILKKYPKYDNGGELTLTTEQVENKLGRKIHWWKDNVVSINGIEYKKVFLRNEFKRV